MPWPRFLSRPLVRAAVLIVPAAVAIALWLRSSAPTTLLIVRHADRAGREDALSPLGVARAAALAHVIGNDNVTAIYHSDTSRARDTAAPLARALGVTPTSYVAKDVSGLLHDIFAGHRGEQVLVVGHSNTVPQLIRAAGGPELADLAENEFDKLFVLTTGSGLGRTANLVRLRYGQPSP
jgi:broad specificity phosphatase PhoE